MILIDRQVVLELNFDARRSLCRRGIHKAQSLFSLDKSLLCSEQDICLHIDNIERKKKKKEIYFVQQ